MTRPSPNNRSGTAAVSRDEFDSWTMHVDQRFNSIEAVFTRIEAKIDARTTPNFGVWLAAVSVVTVLIGMAATITADRINSGHTLSQMSDQVIQRQVDAFNKIQPWYPVDAANRELEKQAIKNTEVRSEVTSLHELSARNEERVMAVDTNNRDMHKSFEQRLNRIEERSGPFDSRPR